VNMGDLPQPEQNVLSQMVWSPLERASAASAAAAAAAASASASASSTGATSSASTSTVARPTTGAELDHGPLTMSPLPQPRAHQQNLPQPAAASAAHYAQQGTAPHGGNDSKGRNQKQTNGKRLEDADVRVEAEKERELKRPKLEPAV